MAYKDPQKQKEYNKQYYQQNQDKFELKRKKYYQSNKKICQLNQKERRDRGRIFMMEEKLKRGGCKHCGETDPRVLEFHHRDPATKTFTVGRKHTTTLDKIAQEIAKCDVLCANCHRKITHQGTYADDIDKISWDRTFLDIAKTMAERATCPRLANGAVIISKDLRVLSTGYNGAPNNAPECRTHGCILVDGHCTRACHSESNAIMYAARRGIAIDDSILYSLYAPCINCSLLIVQAGIKQVVYQDDYRSPVGVNRLKELGILVRKYHTDESP